MKWLYPIYAAEARLASTGFTVIIGPSPLICTVISSGRAIVHDYSSKEANVTAAALLRQDEELLDVSCIPPEHGTFNGMTGDINLGRPGGYLYLVWKSVAFEHTCMQ